MKAPVAFIDPEWLDPQRFLIEMDSPGPTGGAEEPLRRLIDLRDWHPESRIDDSPVARVEDLGHRQDLAR